MRKYWRMLLVASTLLVVPASNALDIQCFTGEYVHYVNVGWRCEFAPGGGGCLVCYAVITIPG
jgi:hypothetical protein